MARIFHEAGALLYYDGANLNAVCGISRPGDMGFDIVHINLHKTFSQPHGGGGPGGGPIAVRDRLEPFLPVPAVVRDGDRFRLDYDRPKSIGKVRGFTGPFGVFVRSYAYIRAYGPGLREMSEVAVLNANYLLARLRDAYDLPYDRLCMHEFVLSARTLKREHGVTALDVAKRLMDYGFHPPTIYFPLIVPEALMIEPTETEPKETPGRVRRRDARDRARGRGEPGAAEGGTARAAGPAARRGEGGEARGREVRLRGASRPLGRRRPSRGRNSRHRRACEPSRRQIEERVASSPPSLGAALVDAVAVRRRSRARSGRCSGDAPPARPRARGCGERALRGERLDAANLRRHLRRRSEAASALAARRGQLAAGGGDVAAAGEADRGGEVRSVEHVLERPDRLPRRSLVLPVGL